jgi:ribose transport system ATP-binding protein
LLLKNLRNAYGPTVAVNSVSFSIRRKAITALLGGNGAGKSSLIRLLSGAAQPDEGKLLIDSREIRFAEFSVTKAKEMGIRVVHQELSVCTNLNVAENFFLELSQLVGKGSSWRRNGEQTREDTLATIFPGTVFGPRRTSDRSALLNQMVEIARAAADLTKGHHTGRAYS